VTNPRKSRLRAWTLTVVVFLLPFIAVRAADAQTGTAALVGEVTDAQKQVIPGAGPRKSPLRMNAAISG
jgi:hypothetical protein